MSPNATRILLNSQRLLIMVENFLSQARLRTGKIKNVPSPTNLVTVFRIVYSLLSSEAKEKELEFVMNHIKSKRAFLLGLALEHKSRTL